MSLPDSRLDETCLFSRIRHSLSCGAVVDRTHRPETSQSKMIHSPRTRMILHSQCTIVSRHTQYLWITSYSLLTVLTNFHYFIIQKHQKVFIFPPFNRLVARLLTILPSNFSTSNYVITFRKIPNIYSHTH